VSKTGASSVYRGRGDSLDPQALGKKIRTGLVVHAAEYKGNEYTHLQKKTRGGGGILVAFETLEQIDFHNDQRDEIKFKKQARMVRQLWPPSYW